MSFDRTAQELIVLEPISAIKPHMEIGDLEVHEPGKMHQQSPEDLEVEEPAQFQIMIDELPGAPAGTKDPEILEVEEKLDDKKDKENAEDVPIKNLKYNWKKDGPTKFLTWINERLQAVPKHSGMDSAGLERAIAYMEKLDNEISKAMRMDLDGELDANQIEIVRVKIDDGLARLYQRLEKVRKSQKQKRYKTSELVDYEITKEAQKATGVQGTFVTVPLLISTLARICVNGQISAGHDIEWIFNEQSKKYALSKRERLELISCLNDMGYPIFQDLGRFGEETDMTSSDNYNFSANYPS